MRFTEKIPIEVDGEDVTSDQIVGLITSRDQQTCTFVDSELECITHNFATDNTSSPVRLKDNLLRFVSRIFLVRDKSIILVRYFGGNVFYERWNLEDQNENQFVKTHSLVFSHRSVGISYVFRGTIHDEFLVSIVDQNHSLHVFDLESRLCWHFEDVKIDEHCFTGQRYGRDILVIATRTDIWLLSLARHSDVLVQEPVDVPEDPSTCSEFFTHIASFVQEINFSNTSARELAARNSHGCDARGLQASTPKD
jgi:hypothetical protein